MVEIMVQAFAGGHRKAKVDEQSLMLAGRSEGMRDGESCWYCLEEWTLEPFEK